MVKNLKFEFRKMRDSENKVADCLRGAVTVQLSCAFVFACAKIRISNDATHINDTYIELRCSRRSQQKGQSSIRKIFHIYLNNSKGKVHNCSSASA